LAGKTLEARPTVLELTGPMVGVEGMVICDDQEDVGLRVHGFDVLSPGRTTGKHTGNRVAVSRVTGKELAAASVAGNQRQVKHGTSIPRFDMCGVM
jgi:hypothetical protein